MSHTPFHPRQAGVGRFVFGTFWASGGLLFAAGSSGRDAPPERSGGRFLAGGKRGIEAFAPEAAEGEALLSRRFPAQPSAHARTLTQTHA